MKRAMTALVMSLAVASSGQVIAGMDNSQYNPTECANLGSLMATNQFKMSVGELDTLENCAAMMKRMRMDELYAEKIQKQSDKELNALDARRRLVDAE